MRRSRRLLLDSRQANQKKGYSVWQGGLSDSGGPGTFPFPVLPILGTLLNF